MNGNNRYYDASGHGESRAPVSVGEELDVTIEAVGEKGDGIAKKQGFVLFVPNTREGDRVKIKVTKVLRKVGFAEVIGKAEEAPQGEQPVQEEAEPAEEEQYEDTEDFGEEETSEGEEASSEEESQPEEESVEAEEEKKEE
ncbi:TRAM domain-containing protein [Candidatus Woesearchaeota archaeon]|nr:MAG: TRAM domain-containing protein [Candidatus Woesearchaeota archaeon]